MKLEEMKERLVLNLKDTVEAGGKISLEKQLIGTYYREKKRFPYKKYRYIVRVPGVEGFFKIKKQDWYMLWDMVYPKVEMEAGYDRSNM